MGKFCKVSTSCSSDITCILVTAESIMPFVSWLTSGVGQIWVDRSVTLSSHIEQSMIIELFPVISFINQVKIFLF